MPTLPRVPKEQWPKEAGYIARANEEVLRVLIVERAFRDIGICEVPPGSNRSGRIDAYLRAAHVPESLIQSGRGYWCAAWAGRVWYEAGALVPPNYADCDEWVKFGKARGLWRKEPCVGAAVLYGIPGDASHIGLIIRSDRHYLLNIEGNTGANGYSRNGVMCDMKPVEKTRVLGYVWPKPYA